MLCLISANWRRAAVGLSPDCFDLQAHPKLANDIVFWLSHLTLAAEEKGFQKKWERRQRKPGGREACSVLGPANGSDDTTPVLAAEGIMGHYIPISIQIKC